MVITEELYRLTDAFALYRLDYALCGGLAVAIHGRPRLTLDNNIVVAAKDIAKAVEASASVGFDDSAGWVPLPSSNIGISRLYRLNKFLDGDFLTLDLLEADT